MRTNNIAIIGEAGRAMPGLTPESAAWLGRARAVAGVGTECPSIGTVLHASTKNHKITKLCLKE
jgi:kynurenine formamidase